VRNGFALPPHWRLANFNEEMVQGAAGQSGLAAYVASQLDQTLNWSDVAWLKTITSLPIVVKGARICASAGTRAWPVELTKRLHDDRLATRSGVQTAEDALLAVQHGVAAIWVSNHGARQLDGVPAAIDLLPEIVAAVDGRVEVYVDGGVRRYDDVAVGWSCTMPVGSSEMCEGWCFRRCGCAAARRWSRRWPWARAPSSWAGPCSGA